jgi:chemotaxis response regulator CheB
MTEQDKQKYNLTNAKIGNFAPEAQGSNIIFGQNVKDNTFIGTQNNYTPEQKQDLAEAAKQIQALLDQLSQTYSPTTPTGKMQIATETLKQIEANPTLTQRVVSALSAGGTAALEQLLNHPAVSFVIAGLNDWHETGSSGGS